MDFNIIEFFSQYAYQPNFVYIFVVLFMTASSFGLPIPEEMTLVSAGLVAYMAKNPADFPPPYPGAEGVSLTVLAIVCFFAVLGSDVLIYTLGRVFGDRIINSKFFKKRIGQKRFDKINAKFHKYSYWACGLFRFTPGVRFPGHMTCGALKVPLWQFIMVDGFAALISVPTQIILVAYYGEVILARLKEFKLMFFGAILVMVAFWLVRKYILSRRSKRLS